MAFDTYGFLQSAKTDGVFGYQFSNLTSASQYALPYRKTLKYLRRGNALDWGASRGHFTYFLLEQGLETTAFSFNDEPEFLRGRHGFKFVQGSPDEPVKLPFSDRSFDFVFSMGVLEHVHETGGDQLASLAEIRRVLSSDGLFLCFHLPNRFGWIEPTKKMLVRNSHVHSRKYSKSEVYKLFSKAGMSVLETGRYNWLPRNEGAKILGPIGNTLRGARIFDAIDSRLTRLLPGFAQNHFVIAAKI